MLDNSIKLHIESKKYADINAITVHLDNETIKEWCLLLCLLHFDLIDLVVIRNVDGLFEINIHKGKEVSRADRAHIKQATSKVDLWVSEVELKAWVSFFMRYYRDGAQSVDHIDVETVNKDDKSTPTDLILKVPNLKPAGSLDDLRRIIGDT